MSKLDTDQPKQSAREFWKTFKWVGVCLLLYILCDILGDGFRPILNETETAQVDVEGRWGQLIDSLFSFFKSVSDWVVLTIGAGVLVALLIVVLVSAVRRVFSK